MCIIQGPGRYTALHPFLPSFVFPPTFPPFEDVIRSVNRNHSGAHSFFVSLLFPLSRARFLYFDIYDRGMSFLHVTGNTVNEGLFLQFRPDFSLCPFVTATHTAESIREFRGDKIVLTWNLVTQPREENGEGGGAPPSFKLFRYLQLKNNSRSMEIALQINRIVG